MKGILRPNPYGAKCDEPALRERRALKSLPPAKKRRIGFVIDDARAFVELEVTVCDRPFRQEYPHA